MGMIDPVSPLGESAADDLERRLQEPTFAAVWGERQVARATATALIGYRMTHDLSQEQLAARLGMKRPAVTRLERGDHTPSIRTLVVISQALGVVIAIGAAPSGVRVDLAVPMPELVPA